MVYRWDRPKTETINRKFRRGDVIVEAFQWKGDPQRVPRWFEDAVSKHPIYINGDAVKLRREDGEELACITDWIVKEEGGIEFFAHHLFVDAYKELN